MIWIHSAVGWAIFGVVVGLIWYVVGKGADRDVTSSAAQFLELLQTAHRRSPTRGLR
jgi:hypothetical protein